MDFFIIIGKMAAGIETEIRVRDRVFFYALAFHIGGCTTQ